MFNKFYIVIPILLTVVCLTGVFPIQSQAQNTSDDLRPFPADDSLLIKYIEKYGYKVHQTIEAKSKKIIHFRVRDEDEEVFDFSVLLLQYNEILMIHCHSVVDIPPIPKKPIYFLEKIAEINGKRTLGKYCLNKDKNKIRYFYYRTVVGGICYADFKKTLETIEHIIFNDRKLFTKLLS